MVLPVDAPTPRLFAERYDLAPQPKVTKNQLADRNLEADYRDLLVERLERDPDDEADGIGYKSHAARLRGAFNMRSAKLLLLSFTLVAVSAPQHSRAQDARSDVVMLPCDG